MTLSAWWQSLYCSTESRLIAVYPTAHNTPQPNLTDLSKLSCTGICMFEVELNCLVLEEQLRKAASVQTAAHQCSLGAPSPHRTLPRLPVTPGDMRKRQRKSSACDPRWESDGSPRHGGKLCRVYPLSSNTHTTLLSLLSANLSWV